jgi:hypothetical protein
MSDSRSFREAARQTDGASRRALRIRTPGRHAKLREQAIGQRLDWLKSQSQLDDEGKAELRALLQLRR